MRILLTRPHQQNQTLNERLSQDNHQIVANPLLKIEEKKFNTWLMKDIPNDILENDALLCVIITSENAIAFFLDFWRHLLKEGKKQQGVIIVTIGQKNQQKFYDMGFSNVYYAMNSASQIQELIPKIFNQKTTTRQTYIFYFSGQHIAIPLDQQLKSRGYTVRKFITYHAKTLSFSDETKHAIYENKINCVPLFSLRTAECFLENLSKNQLLTKHITHQLHIPCFSTRIADHISHVPWKAVHVSKKSTMESMIETINNLPVT